MAIPKRELIVEVFKALDKNSDDRLDSQELKAFAAHMGFEGDDAEWAIAWAEVVADYSWDALKGADEAQFIVAVQDLDGSCYAENNDLESLLTLQELGKELPEIGLADEVGFDEDIPAEVGMEAEDLPAEVGGIDEAAAAADESAARAEEVGGIDEAAAAAADESARNEADEEVLRMKLRRSSRAEEVATAKNQAEGAKEEEDTTKDRHSHYPAGMRGEILESAAGTHTQAVRRVPEESVDGGDSNAAPVAPSVAALAGVSPTAPASQAAPVFSAEEVERYKTQGGNAPARTYAEEVKSSPLPSAAAPPGSISITIIGTEGLKKAKGQKSKPNRWCACEAPGSSSGMFRTPKVLNNLNPAWKHDIVIVKYQYSSCLQFTIIDEDVIATATIETSKFHPASFTGSVDLLDVNTGYLFPKARLKVQVTANRPLKGEPGGEVSSSDWGFSSGSGGEGAALEDGDAPQPNVPRRQGRVMTFNEWGVPEDPLNQQELDLETRSWVSSGYRGSESEEELVGGEDEEQDADERRRIRELREGVNGSLASESHTEEEAVEMQRMRARANHHVATLEKLGGVRQTTDALGGLPLDTSNLDARVVWVCGTKVMPCNFSKPLQKKQALAALISGSPAVKVNIKSVSGGRSGGWKLRWDCSCSCQVGKGSRKTNDNALKFQTDMVKNCSMPTWNAETEFPSFSSSDTLDFAIEGVDQDGWPKTPGILGSAKLKREMVRDHGFDGELTLLGTKGVDAKLKVEVAVLCLWDGEKDEKVPHDRTKEGLQSMTRKANRAVHDAWERDQVAPEVFKEINVPPCTVFDLLWADAQRRGYHDNLNRKMAVQKRSAPVKKQPWIWKEVDSILNRMVYDPPLRGICTPPKEVQVTRKSRSGGAARPEREITRMPRPHLSAATHPDDSRGPPQDIDGAQLAMTWPKERIQMPGWYDGSQESGSEAWSDESFESDTPHPYGRRRPVSTNEKAVALRLEATAPPMSELLKWRGTAPPRKRDKAKAKAKLRRRQSVPPGHIGDLAGQRRLLKSGIGVEERFRLESSRRASVGAINAGRYLDMQLFLQRVGIKPTELLGNWDTDSEQEEKRRLRARHSISDANPALVALEKLKDKKSLDKAVEKFHGQKGPTKRNSIGSSSLERGPVAPTSFGGNTIVSVASPPTHRRSVVGMMVNAPLQIPGQASWTTEGWATKAFGSKATKAFTAEGLERRARHGSMFEGSLESRVQAMMEFKPGGDDKKSKKSKKGSKSEERSEHKSKSSTSRSGKEPRRESSREHRSKSGDKDGGDKEQRPKSSSRSKKEPGIEDDGSKKARSSSRRKDADTHEKKDPALPSRSKPSLRVSRAPGSSLPPSSSSRVSQHPTARGASQVARPATMRASTAVRKVPPTR